MATCFDLSLDHLQANIIEDTISAYYILQMALIEPVTYEGWPEDGLKKDQNMSP
jgi:hypothetical protein